MEADTRADVGDTIILSGFSFEVVVCEDKAGGKGERGAQVLKYCKKPLKYGSNLTFSSVPG